MMHRTLSRRSGLPLSSPGNLHACWDYPLKSKHSSSSSSSQSILIDYLDIHPPPTEIIVCTKQISKPLHYAMFNAAYSLSLSRYRI